MQHIIQRGVLDVAVSLARQNGPGKATKQIQRGRGQWAHSCVSMPLQEEGAAVLFYPTASSWPSYLL